MPENVSLKYTIGILFKLFLIVCLLLPAILLAQSKSEVADAARNGDKDGVRALLARRADANAPQIDGATALHWAVYRDNAELVEMLLRAGARADIRNREGITPLFMAALYGNTGIIDLLIKAGANPRQVGPNGETMLMLAARNGNPEAIQRFIAAGVDVDAREPLRLTTALMWAVEQKNSRAVAALIAGGADVGIRSGLAGIPRNYMASRVNTDQVEAHAERYAAAAAAGRTYQEQVAWEEKNGTRFEGRRATSAGAPQPVAEATANQPAAPPARDEAETVIAGLVGGNGGALAALVLAAREGDLESAKLLVEAGADVNQVTNYGWSPLLTATNNRNYKVGKYLVEQGADVNLANKGGWTPLYLATDNRNIESGDFPVPKPDIDHLEYIRFLLEHGAKPNLRVKDNTLTRTIFTMQWFFESGATAFIRAAQSGDVELMKLLLAHGADPALVTDHGDTALTAAAGIGWVEGVTYEHSAQHNLEAVRMLLDLGLDPNWTNKDGRTPLMGAALKGRNEAVRLLVDRGAKLDTRDKGSRDTEDVGSIVAGHTWQAIDYADGLVRVGVQSAVERPETAALLRKLMMERGLPVPPVNRVIESVCIVEICKERVW
jgi:uncharacterized protein